MSAWVDADRDGELDAGEPYVIFGSDFASADLTEEGFYDYEFPEDFTVEIGPGSTRVGRGGHYSILVLRFTNPAGRTEVSHVGLPVAVDAALANLPAGVEISAGPSRGQEIICVNASGSGNAPASVGPCRTSDTGHLAVFYRVPLDGVDAHMQHDVLRIHYDRDRDGHFDHALSPYDTSVDTEPSRRLYLPVAKAANYIALGDSYSSGENGDTPESSAYQSGIGDADGECRRWDQAYPYIFNRNYLKNPQLAVDVTFKTFACTGAITHNIHNPADPHPTPPPETAHHTDRPSPHAALGRAVYLGEPPNQRVKHERDPRWEPRQGASLANFEAMRDVDMVTVTIGGNDAEFSDRIRSCALVRACNPTVSDALLAEIEQSAVDVLARVKQTAPDAAIFVLGYPYLTPEVDPCGNPREIPQPSSAGAPFVELDFSGLPDGCEAQWDMYFDAVDTCDSLSATGVVRGSLFYIIGAPLQEVLGDDRTRLDYREAKAMWAVADGLNAKLRSAAGRAGVHFVDVVGGVPLEDAPRGFVGHSSCNREDPWLNGFVVKSSRRPSLDGSDGSSFHPTAAGQAAYALLLEEYIKVQIEAGAVLSEAGLPVNPESSGHTGHGARGLVDSSPRSTGGQGDTAGAGGAQDSGSGRGRGAVQAVASVGLLVARPATQVSGCAAPFVSSGEQVTLSAAGFATDATVSFAARAMSLGDTQLTAPQIAATTADSDGAIAAVWAVPAAVTFTPDPGFWGTVETSYVVYDSWGIGVEADLTVTVAAGCTITGVAGAVRIEGTEGDDVICVPDPDDRRALHVIDAKGGNDIILGGAGVDLIYTGAGADIVYAGGGSDHIDAGSGIDTIYGGSGFDTVYSTDLTDTVYDDPDGSEIVVAPAVMVEPTGPVTSDDWHYVDVSETVIIDVLANDYDPNEDLDVVTLRIIRQPTAGTAAVESSADHGPTIEYTAAGEGGTDSFTYEVCDRLGACATAEVAVMVGTTGCTITGTDGSDTLNGTAGDDVICGLGGDDTIYGLAGNDFIVGGAGADSLYGGDATLIGAADGDDLLWGGSGDDTLYGGNGADTLYGGAGDDTLYGNRRDDRIYGGEGNDTAVGGGEDDLIFGGVGDDTLDGHAGNDAVHGGPGSDTIHGGNGDDTLWGGQGADTVVGGTGDDTLHGGAGDDNLDGNTQDDTLWGGPGDDTLNGKGHDDQLQGGPGDDTIRGGAGDDRVYGGSGDDTIDGGTGANYLNGGLDTDTCNRAETTTRCEIQGRSS